MIEIDGSLGAGGGQVLRTALSLSAICQKPFRMVHVRKGRKKPGLMAQHLLCVRALQQICGAQVRGDRLGSEEVVFQPGLSRWGEYDLPIATAGSTSLLLQAVLPPLIMTAQPSTMTLSGGTHVPFSPCYDYIAQIFLPALRKMGVPVESRIDQYGFYPKGCGKVRVSLGPAPELKPLDLTDRGEMRQIRGISAVANLPDHIGKRQQGAVLEVLAARGYSAEVEIRTLGAVGPGTFVFLKAETGSGSAGFSALGERGKRAEVVGREAAGQLLDYADSGASLDLHLADQILLYLALARGESRFTTSRITNHLLTNLDVIKRFLEVEVDVRGTPGRPGLVILNSRRP